MGDQWGSKRGVISKTAFLLIFVTIVPGVFTRRIYTDSYEPAYQPPVAPVPYSQAVPTYQQAAPSYPAYAPPTYQPPPSTYSYQAALSAPAYQPPPVQNYQKPPVQSYQAPPYQVGYEQQPSYAPSPSYQPPVPSYQPNYSPSNYQAPVYEQSYTPSYEAVSYQPNYYPANKPAKYEKQSNYNDKDNYGTTYLELNVSTHCGIVPATNDYLYSSSKDVAPFGKYPWVVQITDDYDNFVCQGVVIQHRLILTAASCIPYGSAEEYRVRIGDWDLLTNYNEYEAYKNRHFKICSSSPVSHESGYLTPSYSKYNGGESDGYGSRLVVLEIDGGYNVNDKYPAYRHICLPDYHETYHAPAQQYQASYTQRDYASSPSYYQQKSYSSPPYQSSYGPSYPSSRYSYSPTPYQNYESSSYSSSPSYESNNYDTPSYTDCWVVGWYGSATKRLQNHPSPTEIKEYGDYSYRGGNDDSYEYPSSYMYGYSYKQESYESYDRSKIQRRAQVKEVECPSYGKQKSSYGGDYQYHSDDDVCFLGDDGYDPCVADKGAAIFCLVADKGGYDSGYSSGYTSYQKPAYSASYKEPHYGSHYYDESIEAAESPEKEDRIRAVLYAIVQTPTKCSPERCTRGKYYYGAGSDYPKGRRNYSRKQRPIKATLVSKKVVDSLTKISYNVVSAYPKNSYC